MNQLTGMNTGIIKSPQGELVITLKFATNARSQQLVYLPPDQLQSMLFATFSGYCALQHLYRQTPDPVREQVIICTQMLGENIPAILPDEVNNPRVERWVTDFVMKQRHEKIIFLFFLKNGEIITLELAYAQMECVLGFLLTTVQNASDAQLKVLCLSANDFLPLYTVDFISSGGQGINYNQFSPSEWKLGVFNTFHSIVFIQPDGIISCGAIIKAAVAFEPERIENIAQFLLHNNTLLSPYKDHTMTIDHVRLDVPANEGSLERLMRSHLSHRTAKMN